ncbi:MAG TPA: isoprenyl transferase [Firmicutes bacterium]|nr:isoprenyl transferase [Bacillota bacterium]
MFFKKWFGSKSNRRTPEDGGSPAHLIDKNRIPKHIAIIMDGNGRWAQKRGMPRAFGHRAGVEALRDTVKLCSELGVQILTVYAFSTENWKRPKEEVNMLMNLLIEYLQKEVDELHNQRVQVRFVGETGSLPQPVQREIARARDITGKNQGLILNIAVNYGGRKEIVEGVKKIYQDLAAGMLTLAEVDDRLFANYLYTGGLADPDLLIRPSGDYRVSNFLLWQLAYTEFWFSDILWPDFSRQDLMQAIHDFQCRDRRFGGLKNKKQDV